MLYTIDAAHATICVAPSCVDAVVAMWSLPCSPSSVVDTCRGRRCARDEPRTVAGCNTSRNSFIAQSWRRRQSPASNLPLRGLPTKLHVTSWRTHVCPAQAWLLGTRASARCRGGIWAPFWRRKRCRRCNLSSGRLVPAHAGALCLGVWIACGCWCGCLLPMCPCLSLSQRRLVLRRPRVLF